MWHPQWQIKTPAKKNVGSNKSRHRVNSCANEYKAKLLHVVKTLLITLVQLNGVGHEKHRTKNSLSAYISAH